MKKKSKNGSAGRKPLPDPGQRIITSHVYMTDDVYAELKEQAKKEGLPYSIWAARILVAYVRQVKSKEGGPDATTIASVVGATKL